MNIITLTAEMGYKIYVNPEKISIFGPSGEGGSTSIISQGIKSLMTVKETPEEVLKLIQDANNKTEGK